LPLLEKSNYRPSLLFPGRHLQTIIPGLYRKSGIVTFQRERIDTPDGDFLDLDWSYPDEASEKLIIISHGLEGNSTRPYNKSMVYCFVNSGWNALAWNYRGCSGEMNKTKKFYHSGATYDLKRVIDHAISLKKFKEIVLCGFSLGGNLTLKLLGEYKSQIPSEIKAGVTFSVPSDLHDACIEISKWQNFVYARRFLKSLTLKVKTKAALMAETIDLKPLEKVKTLMDFDDHYTAPIHGFENALDYYQRNSANGFIQDIEIPALIVNSANDPFLGKKCFPIEKAKDNLNVHLEIPLAGGHCGFASFNKGFEYWPGLRALEFIGSAVD